MSKSLRIGWQNAIDDAIISAGSAVDSLPAANLKFEDIARVWRSSNGSPDWLLADIGDQIVGVTMLAGTNLTQADTVRVRISTTDNTGEAGDAYDSGSISASVDPAYARFVHFIEPAVNGRYLRIDLSQSEAPEVGRWMAGPVWTPSRHMAFGMQPLVRDASRRAYSLGLNVFTDFRRRQRGYRFTLRGLTGIETRSEIETLNLLSGIGRDILVCIDKDSTNMGRDSIWGLQEQPAVPTVIESDLWEVEMEVWERL